MADDSFRGHDAVRFDILFGLGLIVFACVAALIFVVMRAWRERVPWRNVRYDDAAAEKTAKVFYDLASGLAGKPDFILSTRNGPVPIEVKTGITPPSPLPGHVMQLAAYCYLIEKCEGVKVRKGILRYPDASYEISYTIDLRERLFQALEAIRTAERDGYPRNHHDRAKCFGCGYRSICDENLSGK